MSSIRRSPVNILHCIPSMLGGGAERQLAYLASGLVPLGHTVHVALCRDGPGSAVLHRGGVTVHHLPPRTARDPRAFTDLVGVIRATRAELVQTWLSRMDAWGGLAARMTRRPWILSERYVTVDDGRWKSRAFHAWLHGATAVVANSDTGAVYWRAHRGARGGVYVVPNALPVDTITETPACDRASLAVPTDADLVLYTGRFAPQKNIAVLTRALVALLHARPRAVALCCGEGPLLGEFRAAMDAAGLGARALTPGYRTDIWAVMKSADVFVSASLAEGRPNAVHEAMLCSLPMALSDIPQHREFVPDGAAAFFSTDDPAGAARALGGLLDDRAAARSMAARARTAAEGFSVTAMARRYDSIYREVLAGR